MKFSKEEIDGLLPDLRNLVEPRVEQRLFEAFRRVYEVMSFRFEEQQKEFDKRLQAVINLANSNTNTVVQLNNLVGAFSQPLVGGTQDPLLQSVVGSYGPQSPNTFLAGPIPSFRPITLADLPINIEEGEYAKMSGGNLIGGFPVGTTNLAEGIVPTVEGVLYTVPINNKTLFRTLLLENVTGAPLDVDIKVKNNLAVDVYTNTFTVPNGPPMILVINFVMDENYTINANTAAAAAVNYSIFGSQEPL